jgi:glycosyltransferase involved in cell wall biosynthesis
MGRIALATSAAGIAIAGSTPVLAEKPDQIYEFRSGELLGVSIIVVNYNNERFLTTAIDSALGQDYPLFEVIVVDDCSTDNSRAIIARYGDRIRSVFRETNGHQVAALNSAWPLARHPILIFLDSDDRLLPHAASRIAAVWAAGIVKAQFPLVSIDQAGRPIGNVAPKYPANVDTALIREELLRTGQSPSSPGSGNAYSRSLLERVGKDGGFDLDNLRDYWMDAILECNAPFYGEIVTIDEPLACYRVHDSNLFLPNTIDHARFAKMSHTFVLKLNYLGQRCRRWEIPFDPVAAGNRSLHLLQCRLAAARLASVNDSLSEPVTQTLRRAITACFATPLPLFHRLVLTTWFVGVAVTPRTMAARLIALRFIAAQRPKWFERLFTKLRARRGSSRAQTINP